MRSILTELLDMLSYCRPAGSPTERLFVDHWIKPLPGAYVDMHRNWHVAVGDNTAKALWCSHTDTVHRKDGRQSTHYDPQTGIVQLSKRGRKRSSCLGADCTVGVWIMVNMIRRGVPGHYIFHYGEEIGGKGSQSLATHDEKWLSTFNYAIAFDRRGTGSIITDQWEGQTASDRFAESLSAEFARFGLLYRPDRTGTFTDTANYATIIPECTNLSVGFQDEHRRTETLDCHHAERLLDAICKIDQSALVVARDPDDWHQSSPYSSLFYGTSYGRPEYVFDAEADAADDNDDDNTGVCRDCGEFVVRQNEHSLCWQCARSEDAYLTRVYGDVQRQLLTDLNDRKRKVKD